MNYLNSQVELSSEAVKTPALLWWVKIKTARPACTYYFGPFDSQSEAIASQRGYLEDLMAENAQGISIEVKQDRPRVLTIPE